MMNSADSGRSMHVNENLRSYNRLAELLDQFLNDIEKEVEDHIWSLIQSKSENENENDLESESGYSYSWGAKAKAKAKAKTKTRSRARTPVTATD